MPSIFKALASITVWILFILGCLGLLLGNIGAAMGGAFFGAEPPPMEMYVANGLCITSLILAVCAMKLRQMLE